MPRRWRWRGVRSKRSGRCTPRPRAPWPGTAGGSRQSTRRPPSRDNSAASCRASRGRRSSPCPPEAIATIKTVSTEELRKWVATVDEQNQRFATLERLAHEQEVQLLGPSIDLVVIAAVVVLGVVGLLIFWLRDANAAAATTLDNIAALAPEQALRVSVATRPSPLSRDVSLTLTATRPTTLHPVVEPLAFERPRTTGIICKYDPRAAFGWIQLPDNAELFFHRNEVVSEDRDYIRVGARVSFRRGQDERGRFFARDVRVVEGC
jgi:cold shock CspA family protein